MGIVAAIKSKYYTSKVKRSCKAVGTDLTVKGPSTVGGKTYLGNNVSFNGMRITGGECHIGDNFHSGRECQILNINHNYEGSKIPYDENCLIKKVVIEDNVWFGNNVIVIGNVHIGEGAIIQAGAVVTKDIPKCAIAGGNPAQVFKYRDIEHYEQLKREGKFY